MVQHSLPAPASVQPDAFQPNPGNYTELFLLSRGALSSHGSLRTWGKVQGTEVKQIDSQNLKRLF